MTQPEFEHPPSRAERRAAQFGHKPSGVMFTRRGMNSNRNGKIKKVSRVNVAPVGDEGPKGVS